LEKGFIREKSLDRVRYLNDTYTDEVQLLTYVNQLNLIFETIKMYDFNKNINILEIGIGNGFIANALRTYDINITTFDINPRLNPDYVGNILELTDIIKNKKFDLIICFEVLEHMPFENFEDALIQIKQVSSKVLLSLPQIKRHYGFYGLLKLPKKTFHLKFGINIGFKKLPNEHFWELNSHNNTRREKIKDIINKYFLIKKFGKFFFNNYHNYYILDVK